MILNDKQHQLMKRIENDLEIELRFSKQEFKTAQNERNMNRLEICSYYVGGISKIQEHINGLFKELRNETRI